MSSSVGDAIAEAKSVAGSSDLICITGSMILIGEAMQVLGDVCNSDPRAR